ncbi:ATP-binding protein [Bacteroides sp. OttesenSCG-928-J23]|nr:ATP-binding protein [Bacteroides sp. OttesenSCG-928-N06]MDL2247469.1 ATP-binding protein [Bacteroides sp. OttesenSCG-928-J23]MDL2299657.1 ATP-binding protein [Bacteroides sp. OttesenSCG-928-E20]MDL2305770.1 ATP-binding protein [Bacteroides sp. OttesenSCG-928-D19]
MKTSARNLPIGIQTFEKIRVGGYLYVDKTALVHKLVATETPYFLSRPRRFGKSLLLSTFKSYFEGRKDLFEGLAIAELETEWKKYPVLHLDLNAEKYDSVDGLFEILNRYLNLWEDEWGREERETTHATRFAGVIRRAYEQTGMGVVVLIDEYDKPLLQAILNESLSAEYRKVLKAFYGVLKSSDEYLRFAFLTGVTKFAHVSVFSDLNQLKDISMWQDYATICGITAQELTAVFMPELEVMAESNDLTLQEAIDTMTCQYDGYHFHPQGAGMFNPFSVLNALDSRSFLYFWFQTGTPTFLVELLKKSDYDLRLLIDGVEAEQTAFAEYRAEPNNPLPLIYQSGYLTIKGYNNRFRMYTLGFPNDEVKYGFLKFLQPFYTHVSSNERTFHIQHFVRELESGDVPSFMKRMKAFFAGITYELSDDSERHYQVIFYIVFKLLGEFVQAEVRSATGRADAVVCTRDHIYVFEFKLNGTAEEAIRQIDEKGYLIPYTADDRKLVKIGVEFSKEERNISRYLVEEHNT